MGAFAAKIQGMKNAVPKNDKKRRKQLTEDVAKLEKELEQKHKEELEQLKLSAKNKVGGKYSSLQHLKAAVPFCETVCDMRSSGWWRICLS